MSSVKTVWHVMFGDLLDERKPPGFEVLREVPLGGEPQRVDYLLLRRLGTEAADDRARVLRRLWSHIRTDALVELKPPSRPVEKGDLLRLVGYGCQYAVKERRRVVHGAVEGRFGELNDLLLVLTTPRMTPSLQAELEFLPGITLLKSEEGYAEVRGLFFPALVILLSEVSKAERDAVLALFDEAEPWSPEAELWLDAHLWGSKGARKGISMENLEGYEEIRKRFLEQCTPEQRLAGLLPEQRLAGLLPEQRLAGLPPEQRLAGLTPEQVVELLRQLPPELLERAQQSKKQ